MTTNKKNLLKISVVIGLVMFVSVGFVMAWDGPSNTPPNSNVDTPINTGNSDQTKTGELWVPKIYDANDEDYYSDPNENSWFNNLYSYMLCLGGITSDKCISEWSELSTVLGSSLWSLNGSDAYYSTGDVGVGISTPDQILEISESNDPTTGTTYLKISNPSSGNWINGESATGIQFEKQERLTGFIESMHLRDASASNHSYEDAGLAFGTRDDHFSDPTTKMVISNEGNVGIGTIYPYQSLHTEGNIRADGGHYYFGGAQEISGDFTSNFYVDSNRSSSVRIMLRDVEKVNYGSVYGSTDGAYFGFLDKDGQWSILNAADNYTQFRINNDAKMTLRSDGDVEVQDLEASGSVCIGGVCKSSWPDEADLYDWSFEDNYLYNYGDGIMEDVIRVSDEWLRLNQSGDFSNGVYTPGLTRADGGFQTDGVTVISSSGYVLGDRIQDGTVDSTEIQDGSLTYTDTNVDSIQRRVSGSCGTDEAVRSIDKYGGVTCNSVGGSSLWTVNGSDVYRGSGRVGIGVTPSFPLDVVGTARADKVYASGFYDRDNLAYYVDPKSASNVYTLEAEYLHTNMIMSDDYGAFATPYIIHFEDGGAYLGAMFLDDYLTVQNNVTAKGFLYNSDKTLKKNIKKLKGSLGKITQLEGASFEWKDSEKDGVNIGLIAQDVEKVYPELVSTDEETGLKSVKYGNLVAPLIEAIKEQQKQINELKSEIEELKK